MPGANWPLGRAPRAVMAPDSGSDDGWDVDAFVQHHILECKFNAIHRPLQGNYPNVYDHRLLQLAEEHGFFVLFWMYGDRQGGTAPADALGFHAQWHFDVVRALLPFSHNFAMGLGYDLAEWVGDNETNRWVRRLKQEFGNVIMYGCRVRLDELRRDPIDFSTQRLAYRAGDYASFEHRLVGDKTNYQFEAMAEAAHAPVLPLGEFVDRPYLNAERFRIGPREKDFPNVASLVPVIRAHWAENAGFVTGIRDVGPNWRWPAEMVPVLAAANQGRSVDPGVETEPPTLNQVRVLPPGTPEVLGWPIQGSPVTSARVSPGGMIELHYGPLDWPAFHVVSDERQHIGTAWVIYQHFDGFWAAYPGEHLASDNQEFRTTQFDLAKLPGANLVTGSPVGLFAAGPSRHAPNSPEFRRRTEVSWYRFGSGVLEPIGSAGEPEEPDVPEKEEDGTLKLANLQQLQTFRVEAGPAATNETKWNRKETWPKEEATHVVRKVNETDKTWVVYALGYFIGMEANKQDEITVEARIKPAADKAGQILPAHIAEKDEAGGAFQASETIALPVHIRVPPGGVFEGKFDHTNTGQGLNQVPAFANVPHGWITFFCYVEE